MKPTEDMIDEAEAGIRFVANRANLSLHLVDVRLVASAAANRSLSCAIHKAHVVDSEHHQKRVEKLHRRAQQFEKWWAGTKVEADQQMQRVQTALTKLEDHELADNLAAEIGVIIHREESA